MSDEDPILGLGLTHQDMTDGFLDGIAMLEALRADDHEGMGTLEAAQAGKNGLGLVLGLLMLLDRALGDNGTDVTEWAARMRAHLPPPRG